MPLNTAGVAIPILTEGDPRIEYYCEGTISRVEWIIGSMVFLAGNASLISDGRGRTAFVFFLFRLRE